MVERNLKRVEQVKKEEKKDGFHMEKIEEEVKELSSCYQKSEKFIHLLKKIGSDLKIDNDITEIKKFLEKNKR